MVVVLSLEEERYRHVALGIQPWLSRLKDLAIHIQATIPHFPPRHKPPWYAELVVNNAVCLTLLDESHRHQALLLKDPSLKVKVVVLPAVVLPFPVGVPLVRRHIDVPYTMGAFTGKLAETTPQGIVGKLYPVRPMGRLNCLKRPVLIPLIPPTFTLRVPPLARAFVLLGELPIRSEERVLLEEVSSNIVAYLYLGNRESLFAWNLKHSVCVM